MERPNMAGLAAAIDDLRRAAGGIRDAQRRIVEVTATAWSDDRMVKAVVGPRGQLVELELDPRIYRRPNSTALAATIVATTRKAADEAARKTQEIVDGLVPADLRPAEHAGGLDLRRLTRTHDADLAALRAEGADDE
jgi:DNA-binding protein YbaB